MIKTQKQRLSKVFKTSIFILTFIIPAYYGLRYDFHFFLICIFVIGIQVLIVLFLAGEIKKHEERNRIKLQDIEEKANTLNEKIRIENLKKESLNLKLTRYNLLRKLLEKLNKNLSVQTIANTLSEDTANLLGHNEDTCIIYLLDKQEHMLSVLSSKRIGRDIVIKAKHGDIFDQWVLRHAAGLLVEDVSSDFRFDFKKIDSAERNIGSLIVCPLLSQQRVSGILRMDSPRKKAFNLEDLRFLSTICDIAGIVVDNALYYERTRELAVKDGLTSFYLRGYLLERLDEDLKRCLVSERPLSLIMLDLDNFKRYNDQYGHLAGDIVLKRIGDWLREVAGVDVTIGRMGGEEFLIIFPFADKKEAFSLAENIRGTIQNKKIILRRQVTSITVSIGVATFPGDGKIALDLISASDGALYQAKQMGRNRVCLA